MQRPLPSPSFHFRGWMPESACLAASRSAAGQARFNFSLQKKNQETWPDKREVSVNLASILTEQCCKSRVLIPSDLSPSQLWLIMCGWAWKVLFRVGNRGNNGHTRERKISCTMRGWASGYGWKWNKGKSDWLAWESDSYITRLFRVCWNRTQVIFLFPILFSGSICQVGLKKTCI